jgi:hypothetical protein
MDNEVNQAIVDYIVAHRDTYTPEAIEQRLLAAGYSPEDIAAAWQALAGKESTAQGSRPQSGVRNLVGIILLWIGLVIIGAVVVLLTALNMAFGADSEITEPLMTTVYVSSLVVVLGLLVAGIVLLNRRWPVDRVASLVAAIAVVWYLIVAGTCFLGPGAI